MEGLLSVLEIRELLPRKDDESGDTCRASEGRGVCISKFRCPGIATKGLCPDDGDDVQCCIVRECNVSQGKGFCRSRGSGCTGGEFFSGACPGGDDIQCCVQDGDRVRTSTTSSAPTTTSEEPTTTSTSTTSSTSTETTSSTTSSTSSTSTSESSSASTSTSESESDSSTTTSSTSSSTTLTPVTLTTTEFASSPNAIPTLSSTLSPAASTTTTTTPSTTAAPSGKLTSAQRGGIAAGAAVGGFAFILLIIFILMRIARARHNKKMASRDPIFQTQMPVEMPDDSTGGVGGGGGGGAPGGDGNVYYRGAVATHSMRSGSGSMYRENKHYSGTGMGMQMSSGPGFPSAPVGVPMAAAARASDHSGYELESRPSYRPYRPDSAAVSLDGSLSGRKHGEYLRLRE